MSKWEVSIQRKIGYWIDEIFVFRRITTNEGQFIEFMTSDRMIKRLPFKEGMTTDETPPFLRMDPREMESFLIAFRDALKDFNLPSSDEQRMRGELDATKQHLADMQRLVFERRVK